MKDFIWCVRLVLKKNLLVIISILILYSLFSLMQPFELLLTQNIIRYIIGKKNFISIFYLILALVISYILINLKSPMSNILFKVLQFRISKYFHEKIFKVLSKTNLLNFDDPEYLIRIKRTNIAIETKLPNIIESIIQLVASAVTLGSITVILYKISYEYIIIFISMCLIHNIYIFKITKDNIVLSKFIDKKYRQHNYYIKLIQDRTEAKEIRSYNIFAWIEHKREKLFNNIESEHLKLSRKWSVVNLLWTGIMFALEGLILILLVYHFRTNVLSIDQFILVLQSQSMYITGATSLVTLISNIYQDSVYMKELRQLLEDKSDNIKENILLNQVKNNELLKLEDVGFSYKKDTYALKEINLTIRKGEIIALIGENGSGKSTLAKIICKLMDSSTGSINYYTENISAVFQDYAKYNLTLKENVAFGDIDSEEEVYAALEASECESLFNHLPNGVNTYLGKEFDEEGTDISLGQWQKVAMSRCIYKDANLIVFDEPGAALDPLAERKQYSFIESYHGERAIILISHRTGITKLADRILFMENGQIVEQGSHEELMDGKSRYYLFYNSQAKWYR